MSAGYRVAEGTQVNVDGVVYRGGKDLPELREGQVEEWLKAGYIVEAPTEAPAEAAVGAHEAPDVSPPAAGLDGHT